MSTQPTKLTSNQCHCQESLSFPTFDVYMTDVPCLSPFPHRAKPTFHDTAASGNPQALNDPGAKAAQRHVSLLWTCVIAVARGQTNLTFVGPSNFSFALAADVDVSAGPLSLGPAKADLCPCSVFGLAFPRAFSSRTSMTVFLRLQLGQLLPIFSPPLLTGCPLVTVGLAPSICILLWSV